MGYAKSETICWDCDNVYFERCQWMREENPKPVEGWTAVKGVSTGYNVYACPNFKPCDDRKASNQGIKNLVHAIVGRTVRDYLMCLSGRRVDAFPAEVTKRSIDEWSRSEDAEALLGDLDATVILDDLRKSYARFCALALEHWDDEPDKNGEIRFECPVCGNDVVIKERHVRGLRCGLKTARCGCGCEYARENAHVSRKLL